MSRLMRNMMGFTEYCLDKLRFLIKINTLSLLLLLLPELHCSGKQDNALTNEYNTF